jgi:hypothetical protein
MNEIIQGSDEWKALRLGKVTASRVADVVAKTKSGYSAGRANYAAQLIAERLTGTPLQNPTPTRRCSTAPKPNPRPAPPMSSIRA